jgi:hypothetical protein
VRSRISGKYLDALLPPNAFCKKARKNHDLRMMTSIHYVKEHAECVTAEIELYFELLSQNLTGVSAAFAFNLNESDFPDWADGGEGTVTVPLTCIMDRIGIPIDYTRNRSYLRLCIATHETCSKL